jgi:molybdopterin synthase sulfur carrier subunit
MPPKTFQIHYFASASTYTQMQTESLPAPLPLSELFGVLESRYPGIREKVLQSCGVSLGLEYVDVEEAEREAQARTRSITSTTISSGTGTGLEGRSKDEKLDEAGRAIIIMPGDEIAIIPPVSSG